MKNKIVYIIISLMFVFWTGCKEEGRIDHIDKNAPAPACIDKATLTVRDIPGGAVLKYKIPNDEHLLCILAEYEIRPGFVRKCEASYFIDSLLLEGFGDTRTYNVKLYSVGKNEKMSEPVLVEINPLKAPVKMATAQLADAFGGVSVSINNPMKAALAIELMADTAQLGYMSVVETYYTSKEKAAFTYRGLDTIPYDFGVYLRDRWDNLSDTTTATLTPLYDELIPFTTWAEYILPNDASVGTMGVSMIWDGNQTDAGRSYFSYPPQPLPQIFTWDLGKTLVISRMIMWPRNSSDDRWVRAHPKVFELWGSNIPMPGPDLENPANGWIRLGKFECLKPTPGTTITQQDITFARNGIDFELEVFDITPNPFVPVRYVRFRTLEAYNPASITNVSVQQIKFFGTNKFNNK